jgi:hypothetical protein
MTDVYLSYSQDTQQRREHFEDLGKQELPVSGVAVGEEFIAFQLPATNEVFHMLAQKGREAVACIVLADAFCPTVVLQDTVSDFGIRDLIQCCNWISSILTVVKKLIVCQDRIDISDDLAWSVLKALRPERGREASTHRPQEKVTVP